MSRIAASRFRAHVGRALVVGALGPACGGVTDTGHVGASDPGSPSGGDGGMSDAGPDAAMPADAAFAGPRIIAQPSPWNPTYAFDGKRGVACEPATADDGATRCLPLVNGVYYTDPDCTRAVAVDTGYCSPESCDCADYFSGESAPGVCGPKSRTAFLRGAIVPTPAVLYDQRTGPCAPMTWTPGAPVYEALPSAATDWIAMEQEIVGVTDALGVAHWTATDGSRIEDGLRLLATGARCADWSPTGMEIDASHRCVPTERAQNDGALHASDTCDAPVVGSCPDVDLAESQGRLYQVVAVSRPIYLANPIDHLCEVMPDAWLLDEHYYSLGPSLDVESFPPLSVEAYGTGRIRERYLTSQGEKLLREPFDYDASFDELCLPTTFADGRTWCVPIDSAQSIPGALDPTCTPVVTIGGRPTVPKWLLAVPPSCDDAVSGMYEAISRDSYDSTAMGCEVHLVASPGNALYVAGAPVDPADVFAPVEPRYRARD